MPTTIDAQATVALLEKLAGLADEELASTATACPSVSQAALDAAFAAEIARIRQLAAELPRLVQDAERWRFVLEAASREPVRVGSRVIGEPWVYGILWQAPRALKAEDITAMVDLARQQDTPGATAWKGLVPPTPAPQGNRSSVPEVSTNEKAPEAGAATDTV